MRSLLLSTGFALFLATTTTAMAEDRVYSFTNAQISAPTGLTIQVTEVTVAANATTVRLAASFDSSRNQTSAALNGFKNAYISWGESEVQRVYLRRVVGNPTLAIDNGQSMEGELVFPGTVPADVSQVSLVFNPGFGIAHPRAPGISLPLDLKQ